MSEKNIPAFTEKLPEDVRSFICRVTLHLQSHRCKTENQHDDMFQEAYRIYCRYDVENRRAARSADQEEK